MRSFLLFIGYSSYIGSVGDGLLGLYALWVLIGNNLALLNLSLNDFLAQYVEFIYWVKQVALYVMPEGFANRLFGIPAVIYFPVRILMSLIIGWWALKKAEQLKTKNV
ncbi:hypothetical protein [Pseudoalteromonas carrageenovora]|uniref:hypothetical protein n=1 Tax=Pseudoalteromonas carrageenovora TaxID=227 RepID=UPI0026E3AFEF|nr:hypothetical protein [Pseudoalteromonas carrageenovora]MDO6548703.1 hypothetical protein [Pseudoalteromonas carrageenovora]MDO6832941.1 hypothetical protein [Pseudoalteromonas carrageenovora]